MTYNEATQKDTLVSALEAKKEIENHGLQFDDFIVEYGEHEEYYSKDVLIWLGY